MKYRFALRTFRKKTKMSFTEKESLILENISRNQSITQRKLSKNTGISLGLINVIIKKLIGTGYLKVSYLNRRHMEYLLTHQGMLETVRRSVKYISNTVSTYRRIHARLEGLLQELHQKGYQYFSIHGDGELKELVSSIFHECLYDKAVTLGKEHSTDPTALVLNLSPEPFQADFKGNVLNLVEKIGIL